MLSPPHRSFGNFHTGLTPLRSLVFSRVSYLLIRRVLFREARDTHLCIEDYMTEVRVTNITISINDVAARTKLMDTQSHKVKPLLYTQGNM